MKQLITFTPTQARIIIGLLMPLLLARALGAWLGIPMPHILAPCLALWLWHRVYIWVDDRIQHPMPTIKHRK